MSFEHYQMGLVNSYSPVWHQFSLIQLSSQGNLTCCPVSIFLKHFWKFQASTEYSSERGKSCYFGQFRSLSGKGYKGLKGSMGNARCLDVNRPVWTLDHSESFWCSHLGRENPQLIRCNIHHAQLDAFSKTLCETNCVCLSDIFLKIHCVFMVIFFNKEKQMFVLISSSFLH